MSQGDEVRAREESVLLRQFERDLLGWKRAVASQTRRVMELSEELRVETKELHELKASAGAAEVAMLKQVERVAELPPVEAS